MDEEEDENPILDALALMGRQYLPELGLRMDWKALETNKKLAIETLVHLVVKHLRVTPDGLVDSDAMSAGEHAIEALAELGLMEFVHDGRHFGRWTSAARPFGASAGE